MRHSAFMLPISLLLLTLPSAAQAQEKFVQDANEEVTEAVAPVAVSVDGETQRETDDGLVTLRRVEAELSMSGEDFKEIAVGSESEGAAAEGKVVISTTAIIIGLLVLILIT